MKELLTGAVVFLTIGFGMIEGIIDWVLTSLGA